MGELESECAQYLCSTLLQKEAEDGQYLERAVTTRSSDFSKMGEVTPFLCAEKKDAVERKLMMLRERGYHIGKLQ